MKTKAIFHHAAYSIYLNTEQQVIDAFDKNRYKIEIVHLSQDKVKGA